MKTQNLGLSLLVMAAASLAYGQTPQPTKVATIHIQAALGGTQEGQKAANDLQARMAPKQKDFEKRQADIADLQDKLRKGGNTMSQSAKDDLARTIDQRTKSLNRDMEDAQAEMENEQNKVVQDLFAKMSVVIGKYAKDNNLAAVLDTSSTNVVLWSSNAIDITQEIIDLYNKNAPVPTTTAPGAAKPAGQTTTAPVKPTPPPVTPPVKKEQ